VENLTSEENQGDGNSLVSRSADGRSSSVSRKSSPVIGSNSGISPESPKAVTKESLKDLLGILLPEVQKLPGTPIPLARVTIKLGDSSHPSSVEVIATHPLLG